MAWLDALSSDISVRHSPVESGVLLPDVRHLWVGRDAPADRDGLMGAVDQAADADLIIARYASAQSWVGAVLAGSGRVLIPGGNIVYWERSLPIDTSPVQAAEWVRELKVGDESRCYDTTTAIFNGYANHYSVNPALAHVSVADAYADWTARSLADVDCEVVEWIGPGGTVEGMGLTRRAGDHVEILLAGMVPASRGRGGYSAFLAAIVNRALAAGAAKVVISTQDHNVKVQRLWCRAGLEPAVGITVVHAVRSSASGVTSLPGLPRRPGMP
jgi:GNAT superfamily N-acetyltransferase